METLSPGAGARAACAPLPHSASRGPRGHWAPAASRVRSLRPPHGPVRAMSCFSPFPAGGEPRLREGGPASQRASDPKLASCPAGFRPHHVGRGWRGPEKAFARVAGPRRVAACSWRGSGHSGYRVGAVVAGRSLQCGRSTEKMPSRGSRRGTGAAGEGEASLRR